MLSITNFYFSFDIDEKIGGAWPVKCCFVVREIVQTEIAYVQSLGEIIRVGLLTVFLVMFKYNYVLYFIIPLLICLV